MKQNYYLLRYVMLLVICTISMTHAGNAMQTIQTVAIPNNDYKVIGYFPNWLIYPQANNENFPHQTQDRPQFTPFDIDITTSKLTHINFAFAKPYTLNADPDALANLDPGTDNFCNIAFNEAYWKSGIKNYKVSIVDPWCDTCIPMADHAGKIYNGHYTALQAFKHAHPNVKTMLSIGGWTIYNQGAPAEKFSQMIETPERRKEFIDSAILFAKKYGFDGVDIDFEYPGYTTNGGRSIDTENYTLFLQEFRATITTLNYPFLLTIAAPAGMSNIKNIEISKIHTYVDWINLMGYDFNGDWSSTTGHNAPLTAPTYHKKSYGDGLDSNQKPTFYADYAIQYYLSQGVPSKKIVLGMPLYGRTFANAQGHEIIVGLPGLYNQFDHTISGSQVTADGHSYQSWPNIKTNLLDATQLQGLKGYTRYWDAQAQVPYLFNPHYANPAIPSAKTDLITYDDDQSLGIKTQYIKTHGLGGAMFWQLENEQPIWDSIGNVSAILTQ